MGEEVRFEYPLQWLPQQHRTQKPKRSMFGNRSVYLAGEYLIEELKRLGGKNIIISSNLQTKVRGGGFYANQKVEDVGIVVYFNLKGKAKAMACDKWDKAQDNIWALYLSIQAIRGLERWGGSNFLDGLFTGFQALPNYSNEEIIIGEQVVRHFDDCNTWEEVRSKFKAKVRYMHPDKGGDDKDFAEINRQYEEQKKRFNK